MLKRKVSTYKVNYQYMEIYECILLTLEIYCSYGDFLFIYLQSYLSVHLEIYQFIWLTLDMDILKYLIDKGADVKAQGRYLHGLVIQIGKIHNFEDQWV